jgi:hypothetical protein
MPTVIGEFDISETETRPRMVRGAELRFCGVRTRGDWRLEI